MSTVYWTFSSWQVLHQPLQLLACRQVEHASAADMPSLPATSAQTTKQNGVSITAGECWATQHTTTSTQLNILNLTYLQNRHTIGNGFWPIQNPVLLKLLWQLWTSKHMSVVHCAGEPNTNIQYRSVYPTNYLVIYTVEFLPVVIADLNSLRWLDETVSTVYDAHDLRYTVLFFKPSCQLYCMLTSWKPQY